MNLELIAALATAALGIAYLVHDNGIFFGRDQ